MSAGFEIKRLRTNAGKSAAEVAALIGVEPERLRKWEQRDADPKDPNDVQMVEDYFGTPISRLGSIETFPFDSKRKARPPAPDTEKDLRRIIDLQDRIIKEKERILDFQDTSTELSIMNQALLQWVAQHILRTDPHFEKLSEAEKKAKLAAEVDEIRRGVHRELSK